MNIARRSRTQARQIISALLLPAAWLLAGPGCAGEPAARATLAVQGGKTHFKMGEPIILELSIEALTASVAVRTNALPAGPLDTVVFASNTGVHGWLREWETWFPQQHHVFIKRSAEPGRPVRLKLTLNQMYRLEPGGHYALRIHTRRTGSELTSNEVAFDVDPSTAEDESALAHRLLQEIQNANTAARAQQAAEQLNWLPGEAATRIKLSLLLKPELAGPCNVDVSSGLWIASDRQAVVSALEQAIVDPAQVLNVRDAVLGKLWRLKASLVRPGGPPPWPESYEDGDPVIGDYLHRIALTLPQRKGESLINAARIVFSSAPRDAEALKNPDVLAAREVLIEHFDEIDPYLIDNLVGQHGRKLEDPRMAAALRRFLDKPIDRNFASTRGLVLKQLARQLPSALPPYVQREACTEFPTQLEALRDLPAATLPAVDACLRNKLSAARPASDSPAQNFMLSVTLAYVARFASPALLPDVQALLPQLETPMLDQARGAALAYLLRWDAPHHLPLLQAAMAQPADAPWLHSFSHTLHRPADAVISYLQQSAAQGSPSQVEYAASALAELGSDEDRRFLLEQLRALQARLRDARSENADEGRKEAALVFSLIQGRLWADAAPARLAQSCVSQACRTAFKIH